MHALIGEVLAHTQRRHEAAGYPTDPAALAAALGYDYGPGRAAAFFPPGRLRVPYDVYGGVYGARIGMHEVAHALMWECGADAEICRIHGDWPGAQETIESMAHVVSTVLMMPAPLLREARMLHGDSAAAIAHIERHSLATASEALRRWVYAEEHAARAAWVLSGPRIRDIAAQSVYLPFWRYAQPPHIPQATHAGAYSALA